MPLGGLTVQNSSPFQFLAIDTIRESTTNPRQSFEEAKLHELAESIRQHGLIQPITVRPRSEGFEIVAGARWFRAAQQPSAKRSTNSVDRSTKPNRLESSKNGEKNTSGSRRNGRPSRKDERSFASNVRRALTG